MQGQVLSLGPNSTLMTADGKQLVGTNGEFLCIAPDGVSLVDAGWLWVNGLCGLGFIFNLVAEKAMLL